MKMGKRKIVLAALILALGVAMYANYVIAGLNGELPVTGQLTGDEVSGSKSNYGDAEFVSGNTTSDDYFAQARLNRQRSRDEAVDTVKQILENTDLTTEQIEAASATANEVAGAIEKEAKIEDTIKAKGFDDCVAFIDGEKVTVVVKTQGLTSEDAAKIKECIVSVVATAAENINIIEVK